MEMLESYIREIKNYRLLTSEEEIELSKKIHHGDKKAFAELVNCNLRLVVSIAKKYNSNPRISIMDLIQEGNMGLMTAATKYSSSFKTRFSTYAYTWISQFVIRYMNSKTNMISLPHRKEELLRRLTSINEIYMQQYGRDATVEELCDYSGYSEGEIRDTLQYLYTFSSIDIECSEDSTTTIGDLLPDMTYNPEECFLTEEKKEDISTMLEELPKKERDVIYYRFNMAYEQKVPTLREIGKMMGVSAETIRQLEKKAVKKLQTKANSYANALLITA